VDGILAQEQQYNNEDDDMPERSRGEDVPDEHRQSSGMHNRGEREGSRVQLGERTEYLRTLEGARRHADIAWWAL
jgi:hypothetical protein